MDSFDPTLTPKPQSTAKTIGRLTESPTTTTRLEGDNILFDSCLPVSVLLCSELYSLGLFGLARTQSQSQQHLSWIINDTTLHQPNNHKRIERAFIELYANAHCLFRYSLLYQCVSAQHHSSANRPNPQMTNTICSVMQWYKWERGKFLISQLGIQHSVIHFAINIYTIIYYLYYIILYSIVAMFVTPPQPSSSHYNRYMSAIPN